MEKPDFKKTGEDISSLRRVHNPETLLDITKREVKAEEIHRKTLEQGMGTPGMIQKLKENIEIFGIMLKEAEEKKDTKRYNLLIEQIEAMKNKMLELILSN